MTSKNHNQKIGTRKLNRKISSDFSLKRGVSQKERNKKSINASYGRVDAFIDKLIEAKRLCDKLERLGLQETK
jgi:hypothetical protein